MGLLAFVLTLDVRAQHDVSRARAARRAELVDIVQARQKRAADLDARLAELKRDAADLAAASGASELRDLRAIADRVAALSGTTPVTGPGLEVTLADAAGADRTRTDPDDRIQDVDVQAVVNALWDAGAEAMAVNGQRLVATSAIRNAGVAVLVNFRVLDSPYRIVAIGDERLLSETFERSVIAERFRGWSATFGLGFSVKRKGSLELPAYGGSIRFRYARPIEGGK